MSGRCASTTDASAASPPRHGTSSGSLAPPGPIRPISSKPDLGARRISAASPLASSSVPTTSTVVRPAEVCRTPHSQAAAVAKTPAPIHTSDLGPQLQARPPRIDGRHDQEAGCAADRGREAGADRPSPGREGASERQAPDRREQGDLREPGPAERALRDVGNEDREPDGHHSPTRGDELDAVEASRLAARSRESRRRPAGRRRLLRLGCYCWSSIRGGRD